VLRRWSTIFAVVLITTVPTLAANPQFGILRRVRVFDGGIRVELDKHVDATVYTLLNPSRLVIDLDRTIHPGSGGYWPGSGDTFSSVRSSQFKGGVTPVTRIVLDLDANVTHRSFWNGRHFTVLVERDFETDLRDALAPLAKPIFRARARPGTPLPPQRGLVRKFKGKLHDRKGNPMTGNYLLNFKADGWKESVYVKSQSGSFTARLGTHSSLPERYREATLSVSASGPRGTGWTVTAR